MTVPCPPCAWPATLDECGPEEDPSILLMGSAEIGGSSVWIIAIRINRTPRRPAPCRQSALDHEVNAFLQSADRLAARLSDTLGVHMPSIVRLVSGPYLLWTLPLTPASASRDVATPVTTLKTEAELRRAVIDRLIAARLSESKPAWEAALEQWRTIGAPKTAPASSAPKAS